MYGGEERISEIAVLRKPWQPGSRLTCRPRSTRWGASRADRLTLNTYVLQAPRANPGSTPCATCRPASAKIAVLLDGRLAASGREGDDERLGIRRPARRRRAPAGQLVAAAQVRDRRRLRLPDQPRRLRGPRRQPRRPPHGRRDRRLLRRRDQQLPLEPLLDLRARRRLGRLPGGPLLRRQPRRARPQPGRARGPGRRRRRSAS